MATKQENDIKKAGPQSYRDLQKQNAQAFNTASSESPFINLKPSNPYRSSLDNIYEGPEMSSFQQSGNGYWGASQYDNPTANEEEYQSEILNETRYENQPWYDTLANGIGKMFGRAATTFASSLVGLPYGLFEVGKSIAEGNADVSRLWDNDVTKGLSEVDKWFEENMQNYQSQEQQQDPYFRFGDMNWWADNVISNAGFTLGAAASMAVGAGSLGLMSRALGFVNDVGKVGKGAANFMSALFSATGEGMIEARQGVEERNKLEMQRLNDALAPERNALQLEFQQIQQDYEANKSLNLVRGADGKLYDPAYEEYKLRMQDLNQRRDILSQKYQAGQQEIEESGKRMGNAILLANQVILTAGDMIQFSKGMTKSFDNARHAAQTAASKKIPFGVSAVRAGSNIKDGYKTTGKAFGLAMVTPKNMLKEGAEEMNQQWAQSGASVYYQNEDVNDYWKAKMDPQAYKDTAEGLHTWGSAISQGFRESWGDKNQYEQFLIGAMTGAMGSYMPTKIFNPDKNKSAFNPLRYGEWSGGMVQDYQKFNQQYRQFEENVDDLNKILQSEDFPARVRSMVGHTYTENEKQAAAEGDDKKAWKDADDKQFVHDVQAFLRAGKLDDLRAIYNEVGSQLSDEDVENIVKSTTKEISAEEDKQNFDRGIDGQIGQHQRKITELQTQAQNIGESQDMLGINERADYQAAVTPALENIFKQIDDEYDTISQLEQQKQQYVGQKRYEGTYVDDKGNRTATDDEIKQTVKHNSEELNRKLDSYLESIDYVNRRTGGQLTKDQEDNLAYLHHMGKESDVRMRKIMADVRKQLPSKFMLKTSKTPEQLTQENTSSDLSFSKNENTPEGYVEVDTSLMNDNAFADFFQREVMRGGNIMPEFGETADEKAAREEEEKNLPKEEKKKKARERATKKWQDAIQKMQDDAGEQWDTNWRNLVDNFMDNYKRSNNATLDETIEAFSKVRQDLQDASDLFDQAGEYQRTLMEYMQNPSKVDADRDKEETKAQKAETEQQQKNKFEGKDAKQMKQELADGTMDFDDFSDFADMDLSGDAPAPLVEAQQEAKKAQDSMQKANALKQHIQDQLGDNPTAEELSAAQTAMQMVDDAMLAAENPADINIDMPELTQVPLDAVDPNASIDDIEDLNNQVQGMLSEAFNQLNEDENAQNDIPETVPTGALDDVEPPTTGHDETTKTAPEVVAPQVSSPSNAAPKVVPKNPLTEGALATIIKETSSAVNSTNTTGTWRSTTTRNPYGKSTGTYHETLSDKNSVQYKRSKAIWEYLNSEGAFDRMDNASADRIKAKDNVHFMVKFFPEVFGSRLEEISDENKPYAMAIIMLNDNGEVIGDLPLADFEPTYRSGNPTQQVKDLMALQTKLFNAFMQNYSKTGNKEAIVDGILKKDGVDNLNLTFDNPRKSPLMSRVKQVMRGAVPYRFGEINTLNEVAQGTPELAVKVTSTNVATKRGDRTVHKDIVIPSVGNAGQPYLLLPTASGEKIAVPFYMPAFDAEQHRNTELYKQLTNALFYMLTTNGSSKQDLENFGKHMDVVEGLLQVERNPEAKRVLKVDMNNKTVTLHLQSLTDASQKIDKTVPYSDDFVAVAKALADSLSGIPINVSLQYLNDNIQTGISSGQIRKSSYNQLIGEIANVNLPKATQHTVNSWFTVELTTQTETKPSKAVVPKGNGVALETPKTKNRRDFVKEIAAAKTIKELIAIQQAFTEAASNGVISVDDLVKLTGYANQKRVAIYAENPDVSDVASSAVGAVSFTPETPQVNSIVEIDVPTMQGGTRKEKVQKVNPSELKKGDLVWYSGPETDKPIGQDNVLTIENGEVWGNRGIIKGKTIYKVVDNKPNTSTISSNKTIEEIEVKAKQKKIVTRQTKDAWAAIPDELKLKMFNEGTPINIQYREGYPFYQVSLSDRENLIRILADANMAAKAGKMKVSEAVKPLEKDNVTLSREKESAARRWLAKNLPSLSSEERTQFVDKLARMGDNAGKYWGSYRSGVIQIQRNAPMGTVYHEAFHYVMDMLLDPEDKQALLDTAKQEYGVDDNWTAEERLANDFRRYAMDENATGIMGRIKRWLRRLKDKMTRYNRISDATINQLFWKINNGEMAEKAEYVESFETTQQAVLREIRNVQKEKLAWSNLSADIKASLKSSGLSEASYNEMSLEEKEQYIKCRG